MQLREHHREIRDFLIGYGAKNVRLAPGGKHPEFRFEFGGTPRSYTVSSSPSDHRSTRNALSQIKSILGDPIIATETRERRQLSDLAVPIREPASPICFTKFGVSETFNETDDGTIGCRLRLLRSRSGMSIPGLAAMSGIKQATIEAIERENYDTPSLSGIAAVLGVDVDWLRENAISGRIKKARIKRGLSVADLAARSGVVPAIVKLVESGGSQNPEYIEMINKGLRAGWRK